MRLILLIIVPAGRDVNEKRRKIREPLSVEEMDVGEARCYNEDPDNL